jgi:acetylglutamate synthase
MKQPRLLNKKLNKKGRINMKIAIVLKDFKEVVLNTEENLSKLHELLIRNEYIIASDGIVKNSEISYIKKLKDEKLDLKSISIEELVNELAARTMTQTERYHMQKRLLEPSEICGFGNIPNFGSNHAFSDDPKFSSCFEGEK